MIQKALIDDILRKDIDMRAIVNMDVCSPMTSTQRRVVGNRSSIGEFDYAAQEEPL